MSKCCHRAEGCGYPPLAVLDSYDPEMMKRAGWAGDIPAIQWLISRGRMDTHELPAAAAAYGHITVLTWCHQRGISLRSAWSAAAKCRQRGVLAWLMSTNLSAHDKLSDNEKHELCMELVVIGITDSYYWLAERGWPEVNEFKLADQPVASSSGEKLVVTEPSSV